MDTASTKSTEEQKLTYNPLTIKACDLSQSYARSQVNNPVSTQKYWPTETAPLLNPNGLQETREESSSPRNTQDTPTRKIHVRYCNQVFSAQNSLSLNWKNTATENPWRYNQIIYKVFCVNPRTTKNAHSRTEKFNSQCNVIILFASRRWGYTIKFNWSRV